MRRRRGRNGKNDCRKRRRPGLKLRWKHSLIYGPLVVLFVAGSLGYYVIDLCQHPSLWNGMVFVAAIILGTAVVILPKGKPRQ